MRSGSRLALRRRAAPRALERVILRVVALGLLVCGTGLGWSRPSRAQDADWMGSIVRSGTYLSELTIPGTHDSAAVNDTPGLPDTARAQTTSITTQLEHGVRFLDLRLREGPTYDPNDPLVPAHGPVLQPGSVGSIFGELRDFLSAHPHEMILVSIKHEEDPLFPGKIDAGDFQSRIESFLGRSEIARLFNKETSVPQYTYGGTSTDGRLVLLRRYPRPRGGSAAVLGIDADSNWLDNQTMNVGSYLRVEDEYKFDCTSSPTCADPSSCTLNSVLQAECLKSLPKDKFEAFRATFDDALETEGSWGNGTTWGGQTDRLRISFASATTTQLTTPVPIVGTIPAFAKYLNTQILQLAKSRRGRAGVVVLDLETPEVVSALVDMNRLRPFEFDGKSATAWVHPVSGEANYRTPAGQDIPLGKLGVGTPAIAAGSDAKRYSVFLVDRDQSMWMTTQSSAGATTFGAWVPLGGGFSSNPTAIRLCSGVTQVFARGLDNAIWTRWQVTPGGSWADWTSLGGVIQSRPWVHLDGCDVVLSGIGGDGQVWSKIRFDEAGRWGNPDANSPEHDWFADRSGNWQRNVPDALDSTYSCSYRPGNSPLSVQDCTRVVGRSWQTAVFVYNDSTHIAHLSGTVDAISRGAVTGSVTCEGEIPNKQRRVCWGKTFNDMPDNSWVQGFAHDFRGEFSGTFDGTIQFISLPDHYSPTRGIGVK